MHAVCEQGRVASGWARRDARVREAQEGCGGSVPKKMFGGNSNKVAWHWFLPLKVEFPRGMEKVVVRNLESLTC